MAVDRGGLQYTIAIRDEFTDQLRGFRRGLRDTKREFRDFQRDLRANRGSSRSLRDTAEAARALAQASRETAQASRRTTRQLTEEERQLRALAAQSRAQAAREREAVRIRNQQQRDARQRAAALEREQRAQQQALRAQIQAERERQRIAERLERARRRDEEARARQDPQIQAQRRLNQELFREQVVRAQIAQLQARARSQFAGGDIIGGRDTTRRARELEQSLGRSAQSANSLFFTFRRLVGVLAIFTLAREGAAAFGALVRSGVQFNDTVESATIGVGGLIATLTDVRDATGQSVDAAQELDIALGLAREQVRLLRQDSLRTTATFEQLLDTFQVAVAPGFAAGLNIDEIRQLTVSISQAATAIGLEQNQLAEEIRSLLSGTIQARTTRIATALGITNADIRRLRETGELFDFLEERFSGFAESAERQARSTLTGIRTLVQGAVNELLGQAAGPLFEELLALGNQLFDEVLTIRDEAGNILPNPQAVAAFRQLFEALRVGVERARELGEQLGFEGLQDILATTGSTLIATFEFVAGAAQAVFVIFTSIVSVVQEIADALGLTNAELGAIAGVAGTALTAFVAIRQVVRLLGLDFRQIRAVVTRLGPAIRAIAVGPVGLFAAAIGIVLTGFNLLLDRIFDVDLGIRDTIQLVALGLFGAFVRVQELVAILGENLGSGIQNALDDIITTAQNRARGARIFIASLFGDEDEAQRLASEQLNAELELSRRIADRRRRAELEIADIREQAAARQRGIEEEIAEIVGEAAGRGAQGEGFDPTIDPTGFDEAADGADGFSGAISNANQQIAALSQTLLDLNDELEKANLQFEQAQRNQGVGGLGGQVISSFDQAEIAGAEQVRQITAELAQVQERIAALRAEGISDTAELNSLLRDEADLQDGINTALQLQDDLAAARAATVAAGALPGLREESRLLDAQLAAERALAVAQIQRVAPQELARIQAENAVRLAERELEIQRSRGAIELSTLQRAIDRTSAGSAERAVLEDSLVALAEKLQLEEDIAAAKLAGLEAAQMEADLIASGSLTDGLLRGFEQFSNEFSSQFNAGVTIARQATQELAQFISQSIVQAFDPTVDQTLEERFARFLQSIANIILQQLIQLAIASALQRILGQTQQSTIEQTSATTAATIRTTGAQTAAAIEISAAQTAAAIRAASSAGGGFSTGGLVKGFNTGGFVRSNGAKPTPLHSALGIGLQRGGRPPGISPLDTVPAFLQPGEFVVRKSVVDNMGVGFFNAINQGRGVVPPSQAAADSAAGAGAAGMQTGGLVADRTAEARSAPSEGDAGAVQVVPAVVAKDRELDTLTRGGRNAMLRFMRENAGTIGPILDRRSGGR